MESFLKDLNKDQLQAATQVDGSILILAGAGTGKTKTLTSRLAYLLNLGIPPDSILTLTFTNKAATEMEQRAKKLINNSNLNPLLCTFHKFGLLFLKKYIYKLGRDENFAIADNLDRKSILKNIKKDLNIKIEDDFDISNLSLFKNQNISHLRDKEMAVFLAYQSYLKENNLVDFDDLILLPYQILLNDQKLADKISNNFRYLMVDEYQDTDTLQNKLLKLLCKNHNNICVVGDDDQSIYAFRGAKVENILNFKNEFKDVKIIRLQINYRSTPEILKAANSIISHNINRLGKELSSIKKSGQDVEIKEFENEKGEINFICSKIKELKNKGINLNNIAILYRINSLSRNVEEGLNKEKIDYKIVGGIKFYERSEIKDTIAYLKFLNNLNDNFSLLRIINIPKRGIGATSIKKIENFCKQRFISIFEGLKIVDEIDINKKAKNSIKDFVKKIEEILELKDFEEMFYKLDKDFGFFNYYKNLDNHEERIQNINEFIQSIILKIKDDPNFNLVNFLNEISLDLNGDNKNFKDQVNLMSIHASKGLEFDYVFIIGLESEIFPSIRADLEEERRLAYVALTRAKEKLFLLSSNSRQGRFLGKSRFIDEIGYKKDVLDFKKGDLIEHKIFGIGRVMSVIKSSKDVRLNINFGGMNREILSNFVRKIWIDYLLQISQ